MVGADQTSGTTGASPPAARAFSSRLARPALSSTAVWMAAARVLASATRLSGLGSAICSATSWGSLRRSSASLQRHSAYSWATALNHASRSAIACISWAAAVFTLSAGAAFSCSSTAMAITFLGLRCSMMMSGPVLHGQIALRPVESMEPQSPVST